MWVCPKPGQSGQHLNRSSSPNLLLVVEDDHDARVELRSLLEDHGYAVASATTGIDALAALQAMTQPTAIVLDLGLPLMDGRKLIRILRETRAYQQIPVVIVSAQTIDPDVRALADLVIPKPIDSARLLDMLGKLRP